MDVDNFTRRRRKAASRKKALNRQSKPTLSRGRIKVLCPWDLNFPNGDVRPKGDADLTVRQCLGGLSMLTHTGVGAGNYMGIPVATGNAVVFGFAAVDLPQFGSFSSTFDQYRFEKVILHLFPIANVVNNSTLVSPNNGNPPAVFVLDWDDNTALSSEAAALQYSNAQVLQGYSAARIELVPKITPAVFQSGVFTGYAVEESGMWLDVASNTIEHYGVKGWMNPLAVSSTETLGWYVYAQYEMSFKSTR